MDSSAANVPQETMSPAADAVLTIDLGTSGCKCAVVRLDGVVASWDFAPVETQIIGQDGAEQDPHAWWQAICQTAKSAVKASHALSCRIVAICASTQGEGTVAVGRDGDVLHPAILWLDMRGRESLRRRASRGVPKIAGYGAARLLRWIRLTGGAPALSGKDPAAHMLLIKDTWPEVYRKTHCFLNVLDYVNFRLTGRMVATPDSILTSWVTDNRDPAKVTYRSDLIHALEIDADKLPEIVQSTDVVGPLLEKVASEFGLPGPLPVVAGAIDTSAAAVGSGTLADGQAHLYVGTSSWIGAHVPDKRTDLFSQIASVPCARPDKYLMIALQGAAGSNLSFLRKHVLGAGEDCQTSENSADGYRVLDQIAEGVPAGSNGVMYTPWLFGERTPVDDPSVRASFLNLSMQHSRGDLVRAVLEGVALNTRWMLQAVRRFLKRYTLEELAIVGGGGMSDTWCQIFADVMDVRIRQVESPLQANVLGSAYIGAVGIGAMSFDDVERLTRTRHIYHPNSEHRKVYDESFAHFQDAYRRLAPFYRRIRRSPGGVR